MKNKQENQIKHIEDMARILSTVFDVVFKLNDDSMLEVFNSEHAIFNKTTNIENIVNKADAQKIYKLIDESKNKKQVKSLRVSLKNPNYNFDLADVYIVRDDKNDVLFLALINITQGQIYIKQRSEATTFDPLTGAYYRSKLPKLIRSIDTLNNLPIAIFMFNINGMKIINDIFGYDEGNNLLKKCATIINIAIPARGELVRMSGDTFLLMISKCTEQEQKYIEDNIYDMAQEETNEIITPDISIIVGQKKTAAQNIQTILRKTEEQLIVKLKYDSTKFKSLIIKDLLRHLALKNFETTKHITRVKGLALMLGESLGFDQQDMTTLSLAADIHDIGKVLIPEEILSKKDNLTKEDWNEIELHPVTSYSIANALPKYKSTANIILYHHENWDGSGYPEGLRGDEIPLMSRIISIADAYDIMQTTTHYRKKIYSARESLNEIKRCAGTQFDPNLVRYFSKIISL